MRSVIPNRHRPHIAWGCLLLTFLALSSWYLLAGKDLLDFRDRSMSAIPAKPPWATTARPQEQHFAYLPLISNRATYYVDCADGDDQNPGTSPALPWRSLERANNAALSPGDELRLKKGCLWTETLEASWNGTPDQPILISAYGVGVLPRIHNADPHNVAISGSYQIIEFLEVTADAPNVDPNCDDQPYGWRVGFSFRGDSSSYNIVRNSRARGHTAGVHLATGSHHNKVLNNQLTDNNLMSVNTSGGDDDSGAWGVLVNGSDNEVAYNYMSGNYAWCSYDYGVDGASVEVYAAQRNRIHHNISVDDIAFSELGGSSTVKSEDNVLAYNLFRSSLGNSVFLVLFGSENSFGPARRTRVYNNTVYLEDNDSAQGVVCSSGCSHDVLTLKNNIVYGGWKAAFADAPFDESHNIYWRNDGQPFVQFLGFEMSPTSSKVDPLFEDVLAGDFHLKPASPAIDSGTDESLAAGFAHDLDGTAVPQGAGVDIGAYEQ